MARITLRPTTAKLALVSLSKTGSTGSGSQPRVAPFADAAEITVTHNIGRRPVVQVLEKVTGGYFGTDEGFGTDGFGSSEVYREIEPVHVEVRHLSVNEFKVLLDNYRTGEVRYI